MIKNGSNNKTSIVKSEPESNSECQNSIVTHSDMLTLHKEMGLSPLNYDYDNVDIESINIDDIFNESHSNPNWCSIKDENDDISKYGRQLINDNMEILSNVYNNPGEANSLSFCNSNQDLCLMSQANKANSNLDDNKMFLITDILSKDKFYLNSSLDPTLNSTLSVTQQNYENKPQLPLLLNLCQVCTDSSVHTHHGVYNESVLNRSKINSSNINANVIHMGNQNSTCTTLSKTKTILPVIGPSPRNRYLSMKTGKMLSQLCSICNDNATGKHYGVISCEGCKGFFKRTIRNGLSYTCRDFNNCSVDKKLRNRCQSCRFQKCQQVGMKREAVQIERPEKRGHKSIPDNGDTVMSSPSSAKTDESLEKIHSNLIGQINSEYMTQIEMKCNPEVEEREIFEGNVMKVIYQHVNDHLFSIVSWAKYMPGFTMLSLNDQTLLIKMSWGELVVANFTHRSLKLNADMILLRNGTRLGRETAEISGIGKLIDRIIYEILHRFRDLKIDRCELSYLKAIILFNPNLKNLENRSFVQMIRDKLYSSLQGYCQENFPSERFRFSKLLLRLPSLRSIAHNCLDHFRFYDIIDKSKSESDGGKSESSTKFENTGFSFLDEMLEHSDIIMDH